MFNPQHVHLVGGGIGSLASAAFLIRDGNVPGDRITIYEASSTLGGSLDGAGDDTSGYRLRGGRMLTTENYECTWGLFKSIPSIDDPQRTVFDETIAFNEAHLAHSRARVVDRDRAKVPVRSMGFSMRDRAELLELATADEGTLGATRISDHLGPHFFETEFWLMWSTTFAFQAWHSAVEFRRYVHRFILEFTRIDTLAGVKRTVFNQYDSLVLPLQRWLAERGVSWLLEHRVTHLTHKTEAGMLQVTGLDVLHKGERRVVDVRANDLVFLQNGSMTDGSSFGSMAEPPPKLTKADSGGWALWEKLAEEGPHFGNPAAFNRCIAESVWESFTVTTRTPAFFDAMEAFSGNAAGTGGLVTFKDSAWKLSIVLAHQPHYRAQAKGTQVFWGYSLFPDRVGDFVAKPMSDCNGDDLLNELCGHLRFDRATLTAATCIPCRMPYITSMFAPRRPGDRPAPVPAGSRNLALVSQFVELPEDVVFTVEYSVRAAQTAVYQLLGLTTKVPPVTPHDRSARTRLEALVKAFE